MAESPGTGTKRGLSLLADYGSSDDDSDDDDQPTDEGQATTPLEHPPPKAASASRRAKRIRFAGPDMLVTTIRFDASEPIDPSLPEPDSDEERLAGTEADDDDEEEEEEAEEEEDGIDGSVDAALAAVMEAAKEVESGGAPGTVQPKPEAWSLSAVATETRRVQEPDRVPCPAPPKRAFAFAKAVTVSTAKRAPSAAPASDTPAAPGSEESAGGLWSALLPQVRRPPLFSPLNAPRGSVLPN